MKKKNRVISTVFIGIFLMLTMILVVWLARFNLKETLDAYSESISDSEIMNNPLFVMIVGVTAVGAVAITLTAFILPAIIILLSFILFLFSSRNRKADNKPVRIINFCYDLAFIGFIVFSIIKIFMFSSGNA